MTELRPDRPRPSPASPGPVAPAAGPIRAPRCDVLEPALLARLRRRVPGLRLAPRAPGEPVEAPVLLCGLATMEAWARGSHPGPLFGSWHCLVLAPGPGPALAAGLLDAGADGVIDEDEPGATIAARLAAHDRRHLMGPDAVRPVGPWRLDPMRRVARHARSGRVERLTHVEMAVLRRLAMAAGAVVPDVVVLADAFGYRLGVVSHTLETHIYRLRRKLEAEPARPQLIMRGRGGYRLLAETFEGCAAHCA